jgi:ABC-type nitrate/sulfonate/bicarbonate transport system substrate-binding protein
MTTTHLIPGATIGRRALLKGGTCTAVVAFGFGASHAQALTKITITYPTRSGATWPMWIAKHAGIYAKHGLDVTLEFGVHPAGIAMLVSGQAQMVNYSIEQVLTASARDPAIVIMGSSLSKGNFALMANKGINKIEDLKGKRLGIGRLGDTLYVYTLDLLQKYGMNARDVQWVPTGTDSTARSRMLQLGQLDAALTVAPAYFKLEEVGLKTLDVLLNHADIFVSTGYVFKKSWVKDNPTVPAKLIMAHTEAIARFYEDKSTAVQAYQAADPQQGPADISRLYDIYKSREVLDRVPLLQKAAISSAMTRLVDDVPNLKTFDPATVIDMSAVRKLISEGYFRKVFGPGIEAEEQRKLATSY